MEASARIFSAIFILLTYFSPLASSFGWIDMGNLIFGKPKYVIIDPPDAGAYVAYQNFTANTSQGPLKPAFYATTCPAAEKIVFDVVKENARSYSTLAPVLLRLHFHDCFISGCDASILLDKTPSGEQIEKESEINANLTIGFEVIDKAKSQLEKSCPGVVSCADIVTFAARDAAVLSGIPVYNVMGGRRDSNSSKLRDVDESLSSSDFARMRRIFFRKGLKSDDMVILMGANSDETNNMNVVGFYKRLSEKKGLVEPEQSLVQIPSVMNLVKELAANPDLWYKRFAETMMKVGGIRPNTEAGGQIRKQCRYVN